MQEVGVVDEEDGLDAALIDELGRGALDVDEQAAAQRDAVALGKPSPLAQVSPRVKGSVFLPARSDRIA